MSMKEIVRLENVSKCFDEDKYIIKDLSLDVYEGEFLTILGSSGCGKTTILRLINGLDDVTSGRVYIDEKDVTDLDPTKREVNTIFQNFALFPHMTVFENVSFGLKMKKISLGEIRKRVERVLKLVELEGYEDRRPSQLSGGQQQRVAIARGIVMNPKVLLLDESLCSLDLKLKRSMQIELKKIQKRLGITFIYVTHDQDEALTMSDRIIIIEKGNILEDGSPRDIYQNPRTSFVADFIGESNIFKGIISDVKDYSFIKIGEVILKIRKEDSDEIGKKVSIMIRPENIKLSFSKLANSIKGIIKDVIYDGAISKLFVMVCDKVIFRVNVSGNVLISEGDTVFLNIKKDNIIRVRGKSER